jgi:hypothetical protein
MFHFGKIRAVFGTTMSQKSDVLRGFGSPLAIRLSTAEAPMNRFIFCGSQGYERPNENRVTAGQAVTRSGHNGNDFAASLSDELAARQKAKGEQAASQQDQAARFRSGFAHCEPVPVFVGGCGERDRAEGARELDHSIAFRAENPAAAFSDAAAAVLIRRAAGNDGERVGKHK